MRHWSLEDWTRFLFSFEGRASRSDYWRFVLLSLGASFLIGFVQGFSRGFAGGTGASAPAGLVLAGGFVSFLVGCASFAAHLAVGTRRLHDLGRSGWYQATPLAFLAMSLVFLGLSTVAGGRSPFLLMAIGALLFAGAVGIWLLVQMGFVRGDVGRNAYGPNPLAARFPVSPGGPRRPIR